MARGLVYLFAASMPSLVWLALPSLEVEIGELIAIGWLIILQDYFSGGGLGSYLPMISDCIAAYKAPMRGEHEMC